MKKVIVAVVLFLVVCVVLIIAAPFIVDLDRYKGPVLERLEPVLHRSVDFDHIELTILTGLGAEIQNLRVSDNPAFSDSDFLTLKKARIRVELMPLIRKEVKVNRVILEEPVISVIRNEKGIFNFADMAGGRKDVTVEEDRVPPGTTEGKEAREGTVQESPPPLPLLFVKNFKIEKGHVSYRDELTFPGEQPLVIDDLNISLADISFTDPVRFAISLDLFEQGKRNIELKGTAGPLGNPLAPADAPFACTLSVDKLSLKKMPRLKNPDIPSGTLSADISAEGALSGDITTNLSIKIDDLAVKLPAWKEPSGELDILVDGKGVLNLKKEHLALESAALSVNDNRLTMTGTVDDVLHGVVWDLVVKGERLRPDSLLSVAPVSMVTLPESLKVEGSGDVALRSKGKAEQFSVDASVIIDAMAVTFGEVFAKPAGIPGSLHFTGDKKGNTLTMEELTVGLKDLTTRAKGTIILGKEETQADIAARTEPLALAGWETLIPLLKPYGLTGTVTAEATLKGPVENSRFETKIEAQQIGFQLPPAAGKEGTVRKGSVNTVSLAVKGTRKKDIAATGAVDVTGGSLSGISIDTVHTDFAYSPEVFTINALSAALFGGSLTGKGAYRLKEKSWEFHPVFNAVDVNSLLAALSDYGGLFTGTAAGDIKAQGEPSDDKKAALYSSGTFSLSKGEWKNFDLVDSVLDSLFGLEGVSSFIVTEGGEASKHISTKFDMLDLKYVLRGGVIDVESLRLVNIQTSKATDSIAEFTGSVDMENDALDMKGRVMLSPRHSKSLVEKAAVFEALLNEKQMMVLPLTLKGSVRKPVPFLDIQYVTGALSKFYLKKGINKGLDEIRKKLPQGAGGEPGKAVEKLLEGIF